MWPLTKTRRVGCKENCCADQFVEVTPAAHWGAARDALSWAAQRRLPGFGLRSLPIAAAIAAMLGLIAAVYGASRDPHAPGA
jgi:hypothetical protein